MDSASAYPAATVARFWSKVSGREFFSPGACWPWTGHLYGDSYGRFRVGLTKIGSHRFAVMLSGRAYLPGQHTDHLCRNRACANPAHLEVVSRLVNTMRGDGVGVRNARKTHCSCGLPYSGANLYLLRGRLRRCRACLARASARWYARRRSLA